ncbi:hypothetical protein GCK32_006382 [Trichostrongylus colubriformis]|uniref:Uncharacterized protein n=1 Tax=Trichostrongylus colubriformis TaxID=6319 RepID=A0AAN8FK88_TRICO
MCSYQLPMLAVLLAAILPFSNMADEERTDYMIGFQAQRDCAEASSKEHRGVMAVPIVYIVVFNKKTRLIIARYKDTRKYSMKVDIYHYGTVVSNVKKFNWDEVEVGVYLAFYRVNDERRNESPATNVYMTSATDYEGKKLTPPGTGDDFSTMYNDTPIVPWFKFNEKGRYLDEEALRIYASYCNKTNGWVANEGFYKFDLETKEWTPIYYDPVNTDFYY